ncbi:SLATT domain-containing protein [Marinobacter sp. LV10R510-11A]|uniref:SLATT domain-containing protein n=1 Tax=Marinobacter sp. LV10R510-11A TaxID=1415568 RepID=UPI000BB8BF6F|nr:SLATT domain-containing protein [Marinobacter sp. LV10R510-11A]
MKKDDLLRHIAETAYNVGFGAKKHFATYDIILKAPGLISFASLAFGIYSLTTQSLKVETLSATFIILGIIGLYISFHDTKKELYANKGKDLTVLFNALKRLYWNVNASETPSREDLVELERIEAEYIQISESHQILFSNWYAHYKFFWEQQIGWIDKELDFGLFRDKIPLSLSLPLFVMAILGVVFFTDAVNYVCAFL